MAWKKGEKRKISKVGTTKLKKKFGAGPGVQTLYDQENILTIEHVPTGYSVNFPAFIENFSDAYNSEWSAEQVYGRMDPIATFQHTRRAIAVSWNIPAADEWEAANNLGEVSKLISFLYPLYNSAYESAVLNMGPLVRVKFANLIHNADTGGGLLGYLNGFTTDVPMDQGMFGSPEEEGDEEGTVIPNTAAYYPKNIRLNFEMNVLHEHKLGWTITAAQPDQPVLRGGRRGFPYGMGDYPGFGVPDLSGIPNDRGLKDEEGFTSTLGDVIARDEREGVLPPAGETTAESAQATRALQSSNS